MNGPSFFQTMMGRKFYEHDVPQVANSLKRIADALEKTNKNNEELEKSHLFLAIKNMVEDTVYSQTKKLPEENISKIINDILNNDRVWTSIDEEITFQIKNF